MRVEFSFLLGLRFHQIEEVLRNQDHHQGLFESLFKTWKIGADFGEE